MRSESRSGTLESGKQTQDRDSLIPSTARVTSSPNSLSKTAERIQQVARNIETVILGKSDAVRLTLVALLARGHLLIEDVPGVGKTMLDTLVYAGYKSKLPRVSTFLEQSPLSGFWKQGLHLSWVSSY